MPEQTQSAVNYVTVKHCSVSLKEENVSSNFFQGLWKNCELLWLLGCRLWIMFREIKLSALSLLYAEQTSYCLSWFSLIIQSNFLGKSSHCDVLMHICAAGLQNAAAIIIREAATKAIQVYFLYLCTPLFIDNVLLDIIATIGCILQCQIKAAFRGRTGSLVGWAPCAPLLHVIPSLSLSLSLSPISCPICQLSYQ